MYEEQGGFSTEGGSVTLKCLTDEANPVANIIWTRGNDVITTGITNTEVTKGTKYNGKKRDSVLTFTASRTDNNVAYTCALREQEQLKDQHTVQVKCM